MYKINSKKIVVGLGTGRCGTRSLTKLLDSHPDIRAYHENCGLKWEVDTDAPLHNIKQLGAQVDEPYICDVAFYWLDHINNLINEREDTKFICIKRDREDTVNSFVRSGSFAMHHRLLNSTFEKKDVYRLSENVTQEELDNMDKATRDWVEAMWDVPIMHTISGTSSEEIKERKKWFGYYWEEYYKESERWQEKYPDNFMIIDMNKALNTEEGKSEIFNFIGIVPNTAIQ